MTNLTKTVWKSFGEKAKETASVGKERFLKWKETEKMKKYKEQVERKDFLGNQILFIKTQIAETEEKLRHLRKTSHEQIIVPIDGMDISVSIDSILMQYEKTLASLNKQKEKMGKEFLSLEEKINNEQEIAEKVQEIQTKKEIRYRSFKTNSILSATEELLPLLAELPTYLEDGEEFTIEESFGLLELRYKQNQLECFHNGFIIHMKLDMFGGVEEVGIVDWRQDEAVYLAHGQAENITALEWKNGTFLDYQHEFFETMRALKYVYLNHFEREDEN